eukprot:g2216.t1
MRPLSNNLKCKAIVPKHPSNKKAVWCDHCEVWCRSESAFQHHKRGRKHLQPKVTVDTLYNTAFGNIDVGYDKKGYWKDVARQILEHRRKINMEASDSKLSIKLLPAAKVLLFYKYIQLSDLNALHEWQQNLGRLFNLCGRVRIGSEGINGTVSGTPLSIKMYIEAMRQHSRWSIFFADIDFKESDNKILNDSNKKRAKNAFSNFWVRQCKEIVVMGEDPQVIKASDGGLHLKPQEFHDKLLQSMRESDGSGTALLDVRNLYESAIGTMDGALRLPTRHFSEFPKVADEIIKEQNLRNKSVFMYCTGGIRCERASAYLKAKGVKNCYQLEGGIHRYVERFGKDGLFRGKNFVFDRRVSSERVGNKVVGKCVACKVAAVDEYASDFTCDTCGVWILVCMTCKEKISRERKVEPDGNRQQGNPKKRKLNRAERINDNMTDKHCIRYTCEYCSISRNPKKS